MSNLPIRQSSSTVVSTPPPAGASNPGASSLSLSLSKGPYDIDVYRLPLSNEIEVVGSNREAVESTRTLLFDLPTYLKQSKDVGVDWGDILGTPRVTVEAIIEHVFKIKNNKAKEKDEIQEILRLVTAKGINKDAKIIKETFKKLQAAAPPKPSSKNSLARRGEHVINNGVLSIYKDILNKYHSSDAVGLGQFTKTPQMLQDIKNPVDSDTAMDIEQMVAIFSEKENYVDANAHLFGGSITLLTTFAFDFMNALHTRNDYQIDYCKDLLKTTVENMISYNAYVDFKALDKWTEDNKNKPKTLQKYGKAKEKVETMLIGLTDKCQEWVDQIVKATETK